MLEKHLFNAGKIHSPIDWKRCQDVRQLGEMSKGFKGIKEAETCRFLNFEVRNESSYFIGKKVGQELQHVKQVGKRR